jgi:hypothetical protein
VHRRIGWYGKEGLADRSHRPDGHPAQTSQVVEAAICELRRAHPRWGQRRLAFELGRGDCPGPVPSLTTIYRVPVRHGLINPVPRRRRREDYRRWERERPMELWQLDIVDGIQRLRAGRPGRAPAPVGIRFAGQRVTIRIDRGVLQLAADGVLLRSLPNPLTAAEIARIRDARPAGPATVPAAEPIRVQRRVFGRGALVVAGRRIRVGIGDAGRPGRRTGPTGRSASTTPTASSLPRCHAQPPRTSPTRRQSERSGRHERRRDSRSCAPARTARPWVFGSVARATAKPESEMDVHYQLEPDRRLGWAIEQLAHELAVHRQSGWPRKTT